MAKKKLPKLEYIMRKEVIDKKTVKNFVSDLKMRRMIRPNKVKTLLTELRNARHFSSPIVTNKINGKYRLIDGNHRFEAINQIIKENPSFKIEIWNAIHRGLSLDEERQVFKIWNIGTKQSPDDFLKIYWDTIPLGRILLDKIPCTIYRHPTKIRAKTIVSAHFGATTASNKFTGLYRCGVETMLKKYKALTHQDIKMMMAFMKDMGEVFGAFNPKYPFWKTSPVSAFYTIWMNNLTRMSRTHMLKAFKRVFLKPSTTKMWQEYASLGGNDACKMFYNRALDELKTVRGIGKSTFI